MEKEASLGSKIFSKVIGSFRKRPIASTVRTLGGVGMGLGTYDIVKGFTYPSFNPKDIIANPLDDKKIKELVKDYERTSGRNLELINKPGRVTLKVVNDLYWGKKEHSEASKRLIKGAIKSILKSGKNAAAGIGKGNIDYVFVPDGVNRAALQHEIGHLKDKRMKKAVDEKLDPKNILSSILSKSKYDKFIMRPELTAWRNVQKTKESTDLKKKALGSYNRSFHFTRGAIALPLGLLTILQTKV